MVIPVKRNTKPLTNVIFLNFFFFIFFFCFEELSWLEFSFCSLNTFANKL